MIIPGYYPVVGGAEQQLANLAPLLQARGVELSVLTRQIKNYQPPLPDYEVINNVPVYRSPIPGPVPTASIIFTLATLRILRQLRPDVMHVHGLFSPATTALLAKGLLGIPIAAKSLRGGKFGDLYQIRENYLSNTRLYIFQQAIDAFITISKEIDTEIADIGVPPERRFFIPNGVNLSRYAPASPSQKQALRQSLGLGSGPIAVYMGRLETEKRINHLVSVWPNIRQVHPDAELLLLGKGSEEAELRAAAGEGVKFMGRIDDVLPYLQAADMFVLPSITEGLSNSLLEAISTGLAAIVTPVGGTTDVIEHGETGWLITPDDPASLQSALLTLAADEPLRQKLGQQARERAIKDYALPQTADRLVALYKKLIANRKGA
jgi:glycosyltransferase involved in cell wall biosynthesis